jgi:hypothetical protein
MLLTLALLAGTGHAAADVASDPATHYPLTMPRMQALYRAQLNLIKASTAHPELGDSLESDADEPATAAITRLQAHPEFTRALADAGLTAKEFVYINRSYMSGAFGVTYRQTMHGQLDKAYDAANVDFCQTHQKELDGLQDRFQQQIEALVGSGD